MNQNQTKSKPEVVEEPRNEGLDETPCSRYVPSWMRDSTPPPPRDVLYAIGTEHHPNEFGMWKGPVDDVSDMLETSGTTLTDVIIRFNADWTDDVLWRWDGGSWVLQSSANAESIHGAGQRSENTHN